METEKKKKKLTKETNSRRRNLRNFRTLLLTPLYLLFQLIHK